MTPDRPLCVDLDGTLTPCDTLAEVTMDMLRRQPGKIFALPGWYAQGRPRYKQQVAGLGRLDLEHLPLDPLVLEQIENAKAQGRQVVLVTGSDMKVARAVADQVGGFDEVMASDGQINLSGGPKARELVALYGKGGFDYIGNSTKDLPVWSQAHTALVVDPSPKLLRLARAANPNLVVLDSGKPSRARLLWSLARPGSWARNLLIFLPLVLGPASLQLLTVLNTLVAFMAVSLGVWGVSLLGGVWRLPALRRCPAKPPGPLVSGELSLVSALGCGAVFIFAGLILALRLGAVRVLPAVLLIMVLDWLWQGKARDRKAWSYLLIAAIMALLWWIGWVVAGNPLPV